MCWVDTWCRSVAERVGRVNYVQGVFGYGRRGLVKAVYSGAEKGNEMLIGLLGLLRGGTPSEMTKIDFRSCLMPSWLGGKGKV